MALGRRNPSQYLGWILCRGTGILCGSLCCRKVLPVYLEGHSSDAWGHMEYSVEDVPPCYGLA